MTPEQIFSIVNPLALLGWLILLFAGRKRWAAYLVTAAVIPLLLAGLYVFLLAAHWGESRGGFGSLAQVAQLFANPWLLLAGWVHYLAFDLLIGSWEVRDSAAHNIPHALVVPCLVLTFLFGPAGFLLYMVIRLVYTRTVSLHAADRTA